MSRMSIMARGACLAGLVSLLALPLAPAVAEPAADAAAPAADAAKKPTKAEIGAMLKACSAEADAKGLTVQKGKGEQRKAYRRACMTKKGVAPRTKP